MLVLVDERHGAVLQQGEDHGVIAAALAQIALDNLSIRQPDFFFPNREPGGAIEQRVAGEDLPRIHKHLREMMLT